MSDEALVRTLARLSESPSDAKAWEDLYRLVWPVVVAKMYRSLGGNLFLAEEAMQEVMLRLVRYMDFSSISLSAKGFLSYVNSTCRSVMIDLIRRDRHLQKNWLEKEKSDNVSSDEAVDWQLTPEEKVVVRDAFAHALGKLTPREVEIASQLMEGRTNEEISENLEISQKTAHNAISLMRKRLRALLFGRDEKFGFFGGKK